MPYFVHMLVAFANLVTTLLMQLFMLWLVFVYFKIYAKVVIK